MNEQPLPTGRPPSLQRRADGTDRRLLDAITAGDEAALALLLARHEADLRRAVRGWVGSDHLADDVMAEVRLALWTHASRYRPLASVRVWLFGIARNKARGLQRVQARRLVHERASDLRTTTGQVAAGGDPAAVLLGFPRFSRLGVAFLALPPRLQEPLRLLFDQQMSYGEIAAVLDLPVGTVKRRVFEARQRLRREV